MRWTKPILIFLCLALDSCGGGNKTKAGRETTGSDPYFPANWDVQQDWQESAFTIKDL